MNTNKDMTQPHDEDMNTVADPFLRDTAGLALAIDPQIVVLEPDNIFELRAEQVRKCIGDTTVKMLAYNRSIPGPTHKVAQGSEVTIHFSNDTDLESTEHWHGLRLENCFDSVPPGCPPGDDGTGSHRGQFHLPRTLSVSCLFLSIFREVNYGVNKLVVH